MKTFFILLLCALQTAVFAVPNNVPSVKIRDSPITIDVVKKIIKAGGSKSFVNADKARARQMATGGFSKHTASNDPLNSTLVSYVAAVSVGTPGETFNLIVDTGSSNTWVGAGKPFHRTSSTIPQVDVAMVTYGSGSFTGRQIKDTVTISPSLVITRQSLSVAITSKGFQGVDGILGIGPVDLTEDTNVPNVGEIPTVTDNLFSEGTIATELVALSFEPSTAEQQTNGEISFGIVDSSKYTGQIAYTPVTTTSPASSYWGIDQSVRYGSNNQIMPLTSGIVDSGTTLILLATNSFNAYMSATGATMDTTTGLLEITSANFKNLKSLYFVIGDVEYELTPDAQLFPRHFNTDIGGSAGSLYLIISDIGANSGSGLDFINGQAFHERFYVVYDTTNERVGFAKTPHTYDTTN